MAVASYDKINPADVIRDVLVDPLSVGDETRGFVYSDIMGLPVQPSGGVARGRSVDISSSNAGGPGALAGSLTKRNQRSLLSASAGQEKAEDIGSARVSSTDFGLSTVSFAVKQFTAQTSEKKDFVGAAFSAEYELFLLRQASVGVHQKLERHCHEFFLATAAEKQADAKIHNGGWNEVHWQNDLNGSALGASNTTMEVLSAAKDALELSGACYVNSIIIPKQIMSKLRMDPQVLSRIVAGTSGQGFAMVNSQAVATEDFVKAVLKEHLGFDEIHVAAGIENTSAANDNNANSYVWTRGASRLWMGRSGEIDFSLRTGQNPAVLSGAGAFCGVYTRLMDTDIGPDQPTGAQNILCTVDTLGQFIALEPSKGTIITDMV